MKITLELDTSPIAKLGSMPSEAKPKALSYAAQDMTRFLIQNTSNGSPKVQEGLLHSWFISSLSSDEAHIKSPAEYAIYQDQGTQAHMIKPVNKKALHWGEKYFSKGHKVSGVKGKHFVEKSFNRLQPLVPGYWMKALEEVQR